jgi:hypothetical protein
LPYVVVTKKASCGAPPTVTPLRYTGDASTVPSSDTCCRRIDTSESAGIPVAAVETPDRPSSTLKRIQSWPLATTGGVVPPDESTLGDFVDA